MSGWIGVDLDGTLAEYSGFQGATEIGDPIPKMVARVKRWLAADIQVKVMTARVAMPHGRAQAEAAIKAWCRKHIGHELPVTCQKDYGMIELWDDRAVQVIPNTGEPVDLFRRGK
jgi:hypothetical protein